MSDCKPEILSSLLGNVVKVMNNFKARSANEILFFLTLSIKYTAKNIVY